LTIIFWQQYWRAEENHRK